MTRPNITPGPWGYCFTSAKQARKDHPGTDGGGGGGSIYDTSDLKKQYDRKTIAFLPHHREVIEDKMREANARAIAAVPALLEALETIHANAAESPEWIRRHTIAALTYAGYQF